MSGQRDHTSHCIAIARRLERPLEPAVATLCPAVASGFDNQNPRQWLATLEGWQARAHAAQQNSFEVLPIFIAGVLIAEGLQAPPQARIDGLAMLFVGARVGYIGAYLADSATLRSLLWVIGLGACIALFFTR